MDNPLTGLWIGMAIILIIELNAVFGKMNKLITSVKAVIHSGLGFGSNICSACKLSLRNIRRLFIF